MNSVSLIGRLTSDIDLKKTSNDVSYCKFCVAVSRPNVKDKTDFIRCVAWRNTAEFLSKYFCKGKMLALTGILTVSSWKDENNKTHSTTEVFTEKVYFCGDKNKTAFGSDQSDASDIPAGFIPVEDDIPF